MKSIFFTLAGILLTSILYGQTTVAFHENFEPPSGADSVTHYSSSATNTWALSSSLSSGGTQSDSARASNFDTLAITTDPFSTVGSSNVSLEFDHICKIEVFDAGMVEVSVDGGLTWTQLDTTHYRGASTQFGSQGNVFNVLSYGGAWSSGQSVRPDNTWWKPELFDISAIADDQPDVRVRFSLIDRNGMTLFENEGWFIDNIKVTTVISELEPPVITMLSPIPQDTILNHLAQEIRAEITDNTAVDKAYVVYYVNGVLEDTLGMTNVSGDIYSVHIPFHGYGRVIDFFVEAIDAAAEANMATSPTYTYVQLLDRTYTFTNAGATGAHGPTKDQLNAEYAATNLAGDVISQNGIQRWVVPYTAEYRITAIGAEGGFSFANIAPAGLGAYMEGVFQLTSGDTLKILVGQAGEGVFSAGGTGGGGSFVTLPNDTPLIVGAGGSGAPNTFNYGWLNGKITNRGPQGGTGNSSTFGGGGGGGLLTDGQGSSGWDGIAFINGGQGGVGASGEGGFGGGGGKGGIFDDAAGGGGYSGGDYSQIATVYGGGGSFNAGTNQNNMEGVGHGHGKVIIEPLIGPSGATNDAGVTSLNEPGIYCSGTYDVVVTVMNLGSNVIDSVEVHWKVNGVAQTPVTHVGTLDTIGSANLPVAQVNLGSYTFTNAQYHIKTWTSNPNGVADTVNDNDTLYTTIQSNLPAPKWLTVADTAGSWATFTWSPGNIQHSWDYVVVHAGDPPTSGIQINTGSPTVTATGLNPFTNYDVYVREVCPDGTSSSPWAGPVTFRTLLDCPPMAYCFTTAGQQGRNGPSQSDLNNEYLGTNLEGMVTSVNGIQQWTVPAMGTYRITAYGAQGSHPTQTTGGRGAFIGGEFLLDQGQEIRVLVGQTAPNTPGRENRSSSGGGGSFVTTTPHNTNSSILVIAGGGGGTGDELPPTANASKTTTGQAGSYGSGGTNGQGGTTATLGAGAGAGFFTDGDGTGGGQAYVNGGLGGNEQGTWSINGGGFGGGGSVTVGGGSRYAGGGGYSGGSGSSSQQGATSGLWGGGGGSFNSGDNQINIGGTHEGDGMVIIEPLFTGAMNDASVVSLDEPVAFCPEANDVVVTIRNFGANQITSVNVEWEINGVAQKPYNFTGILDTAGGAKSTSAQITLGSYTFTNAVYDLKIWTANPNGQLDTVNDNDTLQTLIQSKPPKPDLGENQWICNYNAPVTLNPGSFASYIWSTGENTETINAGTTGLYSVTVTDNNGCTGSDSMYLTVNPTPTPNLGGSLSTCDYNTPVTLDAGNFASYTWNTGESTQTIDAGTTGLYSVTVTDIIGCVGFDSMNLIVNTAPKPSLGGSQSTCDYNTPITLDAGNFASYTWSTGQSTQTIDADTTGLYSVTVTDDNGCIGFDAMSLMVNPKPEPNLGGNQTTCDYNTPITLDAGNFASYTWNTGESTQTIDADTTGLYSVTVTDNNGCVGFDSMSLIVNTAPQPNLGGNQAICDYNAPVTLDAGNFASYTWNTGESTQTIDASTTGLYSVTVTHANGCIGIDSMNLTVNPEPTPSLGGNQSVCDYNAPVTLNAGSFASYTWSTGESTQTIDASTTGLYSVTVTDANGCIGIDSMDLTVNPAPTPDLGGNQSVCDYNSPVTLDAGNFASYTWSTGESTQTIDASTTGLYSVTVTDANGCIGIDAMDLTVNPAPKPSLGGNQSVCDYNTPITLNAGNFSSYMWSTGESTQTINTDSTGGYSVTVTHANGCIGIDSITLTVNPAPAPTLGGNQSVCDYNTPITLDAGNFASYSWNTGESTQTIDASTTGLYSVTVTNANGCIGFDAMSLTVNPAPVPNLGGNQTVCDYNSPVTLDAGSFASYIWNTGQSTQTIDADTTGLYSVTVTDANGCISIDSMNLTVNPAPVPDLGENQTVCDYNSPVTLHAGSFASYLWSTGESTQTIDADSTGIYSVTVTHANGCIGMDSMNLTVNVTPVVSIHLPPPFCLGDSAVYLTSVPETGVWSGSGITDTIEGSFDPTIAGVGVHTISFSSANGLCIGSDSIDIMVGDQPAVSLDVVSATTASSGDGMITVSASGGLQPYGYLWSTGDTLSVIENIQAGFYYLTVNDAAGCETFIDSVRVGYASSMAEDQTKIVVYPNPASNSVFIETRNITIDQVELVNTLGKSIMKSSVSGKRTELNIKGLNPGIYFLKVTNNGELIQTKKIIIN